MVSSTDGNETALKTFKEFTHSMKEVHLPGADDSTLLWKVYALARRKVALERQSRLATELSKGKFRQQIKIYRKTIRALEKTDEQLSRAQDIYVDGFDVSPHKSSHLFEPVRTGIRALITMLHQKENVAVAQVHPRYRKKGEKAVFKPLFSEYDYGLKRLGWKPSQMWFLAELIKILSTHFKLRPSISPPNQKIFCSLIGKIIEAAFGVHISDEGIKTALYRISRKSKAQLEPRAKKTPSSKRI